MSQDQWSGQAPWGGQAPWSFVDKWEDHKMRGGYDERARRVRRLLGMSKDWREKIKGGERLTPNERAKSFVTYIAWAIQPDARKIVEERLTLLIEATEIVAEVEERGKVLVEMAGQEPIRYEYAVIAARVVGLADAQQLQYRLNQEADRDFVPLDITPDRIILRRKARKDMEEIPPVSDLL